MKHIITIVTTVAALALLGNPTQAADTMQLMQPEAADQVPQALIKAPAMALRLPADQIEHKAVQVSRALDPQHKLVIHPEPYQDTSREFWTLVDADELRDGVILTTTAPGAVVRVNPVDKSLKLRPSEFSLRAPGQPDAVPLRRASKTIALDTDLRAVGMKVAAGTTAFRLKSELGSGPFTLRAPAAEGRYLVHVLDRDSSVVLNMQANRDTVLDGQTIRFEISLTDNGTPRGTRSVNGMVSAPDGETWPLTFKPTTNGLVATFTPDASHSRGPELWQARAFVSSGKGQQAILRDARTAFAVSAPTARLNGTLHVEQNDGLHFEVGLKVRDASRYALTGVLYGTNAAGELRPAAMAQSAVWAEPGEASIALVFDQASLAANGLHAPWVLRDLRLLDQARMQLIERRGEAVRVP